MSVPAGPSPLGAHLGFWLRFVSNRVSESFRRRVEAQGVSVSEWVALRQLHDAPDGSAAGLRVALGMTKGAISKIVGRLQAKGLVEVRIDALDRRNQHLSLTDAGRALVPRLALEADLNDAHYFGHLSLAQRERLKRVLTDLVERHGIDRLPTE